MIVYCHQLHHAVSSDLHTVYLQLFLVKERSVRIKQRWSSQCGMQRETTEFSIFYIIEMKCSAHYILVHLAYNVFL